MIKLRSFFLQLLEKQPFRYEQSWAKKIAGIVLALCSVILCPVLFPGNLALLGFSILFALAFAAIGFLRLDIRSGVASVILNIFWGLCCITATIGLGLPGALHPVEAYIYVLNFLCAFAVVFVLLLATGSWRLSISIAASIIFLLLFSNDVIFSFRGKELSIGDFTSLGTALNVAGSYTFKMTRSIWLLILLFALGIFSQFLMPQFPTFRRSWLYLRVIALVATVSVALPVHFASANIRIRTWSSEGLMCNGYLLNFYLGIRQSYVVKPDGYDLGIIDDWTQNYPDGGNSGEETKKPNIIIIMNETFADLSVFPNELNTNIPVTPYFDSLMESTVSGYALSSVFGGNTANSEFEFLTGHSLAFMPPDCVPYQQYISGNICSLPWMLKSIGYDTFATHPFLSTGWSRPTVYPLLGFDRFTFIEDYPQEDLIRSFVSDREMFSYVMNTMNTKDPDSPLFVMGITMQNHGHYYYGGADFTPSVQLEGYDKDYPQAEQYLSVLHETDKALEAFLTALQDYPEDTIVLFFGDHLPSIENDFYTALNGGPIDTDAEKAQLYTVPFFIWSNFDTKQASIPCTSLNYLPCYLLEYAGLELPAYYSMLADIRDTVPAINAYWYYSLEQGDFVPIDSASGTEAEVLSKYRILQYNNLFDKKNRNYKLFSQYLPR